jgi:MFS transporter, DHA3 family, macrolide efflux protein
VNIKRNLILIYSGQTVSRIGNSILGTALIIWYLQSDISDNSVLGYILASSFIGNFIFSLYGGALADRLNKKHILVVSDAIAGILNLLIGFLLWDNLLDDSNYQVIIGLNFIMGCSLAFFSPAMKSILPNIVSNEELPKVNSIINAIKEVSKFIGPAIVYLLMSFLGLKLFMIFIINGISFLISALLEIFLSYSETEKTKIAEKESLISTVKEGMKYCFGSPFMRNLMIFLITSNFFLVLFAYALPIYIDKILGLEESVYSLVKTFEAAGGILTFCLILFYSVKPSFKNVYIISLLVGLSILLLNVNSSYLFYAMLLSYGIFVSLFNTLIFTYIQVNVDKNYLGRVFSMVFLTSNFAIAITYLFGGYILNFSLHHIFLISGICLLLVTQFLVWRKKDGTANSIQQKSYNV